MANFRIMTILARPCQVYTVPTAGKQRLIQRTALARQRGVPTYSQQQTPIRAGARAMTATTAKPSSMTAGNAAPIFEAPRGQRWAQVNSFTAQARYLPAGRPRRFPVNDNA